MALTWTYEGYWNAVLGVGSAQDVVREFDLSAAGVDEWLGTAESESWAAGNGKAGELPEEWTGFHGRALAELKNAMVAQ